MLLAAVSVGTAATLIVPANNLRLSLYIVNNSTQTVYLGDSTLTTSNGIPLQAGGTFQEDSGGTKTWGGAIYGIVSATTADVRYWERTR
jgi:hypothetical protein